MGGGGKGGSSTTQVSIPPEVLARYNAVNAQAQQLGGIDPNTGQPNTPYTPYTGEFVAPLNQTQNAAIGNINASQGMAQPYYNQATQYTQQAAQAFQPLSQQDIQRYQNPFVQSVVDPTVQALQQQQGQQLAQQQTNAIKGGAFGGDRSGIERAVLQGQQGLATAQAISPLYSQAYQSGLSAAQQQQQVGGQGLMGAGAQLANLGSGAQSSALAGANAQLAAGTVGQQTGQALDTAKYQQFLQQQGYPFQVTQFLANIAEGTGALSGSTTSSTQASDERLKHDIKEIGTAHDGLPIYSFKYKGDDQIRIGFMAQDVEKKMPDAVGVMGGYKTVDYGKVANENAKHRATGGGVWEPGAYNLGGREHHSAGNAVGGSQMLVDPTDWAALVQAHAQMTNPYGTSGAPKMGTPGATGVVPAANLAVPKLVQANSPQMKQTSSVQDALKKGKDFASLAQSGSDFKNWAQNQLADKPKPDAKPDANNVQGTGDKTVAATGHAEPVKPSSTSESGGGGGDDVESLNSANIGQELTPPDATPDLEGFFAYGGVVPRNHFATGGYSDPYKLPNASGEELPSDTLSASESSKDEAEKEAPKPGKTGGGGGDSTMSDIGAAASIVGTAAKILPFFFASGGVVPREHHADGDEVGDGGGQTDTSDTSGGGGSDEPTAHPADETFFSRVIPQESGGKQFDKNGNPLTSKAGAIGIAQVMPTTAPEAAKLAGMEFDPVKFRNDPDYNSKLGQAYLRAQWDRYGGDQEKAMAAYNAGPGNVDKALAREAQTGISWKNFLPDETKNYIGARGDRQAEAQHTNRRGSSLGDVFGEMTPESVPTSSNFWVPLLSAIATAGASRAPTRGQALAEGLLGGISGYQTQVEQQSRLAKQAFDIMNNTFVQGQDKNGNIVYFNKNTGQQADAAGRAAYGAQLISNFGMDPKKWGFSGTLPANQAVNSQPMTTLEGPVKQPQVGTKPAVGEAANPQVAADPAQKAKDLPDLTQMGPTQLMEYAKAHKQDFGLTGDRDPDVILADIERLRRSGENAKMAGNMAQYNSDATLAQQKQVLLNGYLERAVDLQYEKNKQYALDDTTAQKLQNEEVTKRANGYINSLQSYQRIGDILSEYQGGQTEQAMQKLRGLAQTVGVAPDSWKRASNDFDELYKLTMSAALDGAQQNGFSRAPKSTVSNELSTQPGPSVNPRAAYSLVGRQIADLNYQMAQDKEWLKQPRDTRPMVFKNNYVNSTQGNGEAYKGYVRDAFENHLAPPNKNVTRDDIENLRKTYGNFTPKGYEKAPEQQQQEIPVISNPADALKLQPGTTFKTPDGRLKVVPQRQGVQ